MEGSKLRGRRVRIRHQMGRPIQLYFYLPLDSCLNPMTQAPLIPRKPVGIS